MRKVNVYKFSEKMPDEGVTIAIIPKNAEIEEDICLGRLVDKIKVRQKWIEAAGIEYYKQQLQADIKQMQATGRYLVIRCCDDSGDIYINDVMDWEWIEVKR